MFSLGPSPNPNPNSRVLTGPQALITTRNRGILINSDVWGLVIDQEDLGTVELDHWFVSVEKRKREGGRVPIRDCP